MISTPEPVRNPAGSVRAAGARQAGAADLVTKGDLQTLLTVKSPCVSLYLSTHRGGSERDSVLWKNLLGEAQERLMARGLRRPEAAALLGPARKLLEDRVFWGGVSDGLAFFLVEGFTAAFRLPLPFPPLAAVADRAHVLPLLPLFSGDGRFYLLALSQNRVALLQGTHFGVHGIDVKGLPRSLEEAMRFHDADEPLLFHTHPALGLGRWGAVFHGHGVGVDDVKDDLLRYFQQINRGLHELLREERAPLVLASVEYLWPLYRKANSYPLLLESGVAGNPDRLSPRELHHRAWPLVEPVFQGAPPEGGGAVRAGGGNGTHYGSTGRGRRRRPQGVRRASVHRAGCGAVGRLRRRGRHGRRTRCAVAGRRGPGEPGRRLHAPPWRDRPRGRAATRAGRARLPAALLRGV